MLNLEGVCSQPSFCHLLSPPIFLKSLSAPHFILQDSGREQTLNTCVQAAALIRIRSLPQTLHRSTVSYECISKLGENFFLLQTFGFLNLIIRFFAMQLYKTKVGLIWSSQVCQVGFVPVISTTLISSTHTGTHRHGDLLQGSPADNLKTSDWLFLSPFHQKHMPQPTSPFMLCWQQLFESNNSGYFQYKSPPVNCGEESKSITKPNKIIISKIK